MVTIDVDMPSGCFECPLRYRFTDEEQYYCFDGSDVMDENTKELLKERPSWCPIIS